MSCHLHAPLISPAISISPVPSCGRREVVCTTRDETQGAHNRLEYVVILSSEGSGMGVVLWLLAGAERPHKHIISQVPFRASAGTQGLVGPS
jgi:hypothetical protein